MAHLLYYPSFRISQKQTQIGLIVVSIDSGNAPLNLDQTPNRYDQMGTELFVDFASKALESETTPDSIFPVRSGKCWKAQTVEERSSVLK